MGVLSLFLTLLKKNMNVIDFLKKTIFWEIKRHCNFKYFAKELPSIIALKKIRPFPSKSVGFLGGGGGLLVFYGMVQFKDGKNLPNVF